MWSGMAEGVSSSDSGRNWNDVSLQPKGMIQDSLSRAHRPLRSVHDMITTLAMPPCQTEASLDTPAPSCPCRVNGRVAQQS
jgi:hypothetical protein